MNTASVTGPCSRTGRVHGCTQVRVDSTDPVTGINHGELGGQVHQNLEWGTLLQTVRQIFKKCRSEFTNSTEFFSGERPSPSID